MHYACANVIEGHRPQWKTLCAYVLDVIVAELSTRRFGMESLAPTFKFVFLSTTSTFEVTGCGSIVIAGERENTHEAVFASRANSVT